MMWFPRNEVTRNKVKRRLSKARRIKNLELEKRNVTSIMLPNELTIHITTFLDTRSFFSLAATCHDLYKLLPDFYKIAEHELRDIVFETVSKNGGFLFGGAVRDYFRDKNVRPFDYDFLFPKGESKEAALDCLKTNSLIVMTRVCASMDSKKFTYPKVNFRSRYPNLREVDAYKITKENVTIIGDFVLGTIFTQKICDMDFPINALIIDPIHFTNRVSEASDTSCLVGRVPKQKLEYLKIRKPNFGSRSLYEHLTIKKILADISLERISIPQGDETYLRLDRFELEVYHKKNIKLHPSLWKSYLCKRSVTRMERKEQTIMISRLKRLQKMITRGWKMDNTPLIKFPPHKLNEICCGCGEDLRDSICFTPTKCQQAKHCFKCMMDAVEYPTIKSIFCGHCGKTSIFNINYYIN